MSATPIKPQPLYSYNQLLDKEQPQVSRPADVTERRYFLVGSAVYDLKEFTLPHVGFWHTNADQKIAVCQFHDHHIMVGRVK